MAVPAVNTIMTPNNSRITITGNSQNFFLSFRKPHKSFTKPMLIYSRQ
jgi:hypothetical protein